MIFFDRCKNIILAQFPSMGERVSLRRVNQLSSMGKFPYRLKIYLFIRIKNPIPELNAVILNFLSCFFYFKFFCNWNQRNYAVNTVNFDELKLLLINIWNFRHWWKEKKIKSILNRDKNWDFQNYRIAIFLCVFLLIFCLSLSLGLCIFLYFYLVFLYIVCEKRLLNRNNMIIFVFVFVLYKK